MTFRATQLLRALNVVQAAGTQLDPVWNPHESAGFSYRGSASALDDATLAADLEELAAKGYLESIFIERISLCPTCDSHAINVHESCLTCNSSNLVSATALFHFRCGFVGPTSAFKEEPQGRRCPKCSKILADVGTDFDSPGTYFTCQACTAMFQLPEVGARCLSCGARFTGTDMANVKQRDVVAYRLSALGIVALSENRLLGETPLVQPSTELPTPPSGSGG